MHEVFSGEWEPVRNGGRLRGVAQGRDPRSKTRSERGRKIREPGPTLSVGEGGQKGAIKKFQQGGTLWTQGDRMVR